MEKVRYMISDASSMVNVESHVLRYWEDELELNIPRNEMGHRYYTQENIKEFQYIKELKEKGYQLKAIKMIVHNGDMEQRLPELTGNEADKPGGVKNHQVYFKNPETLALAEAKQSILDNTDRMAQFTELMTDIVGKAIAANNENLSRTISEDVGEQVLKEMNYLMREQEEQEKKEAAVKAAKEHKKYGFISVSVGEGLSTLFKELNVDYIIEGGQTMNPSTEDMLNAIAEVNADTIYIFPNNKNIVLAANQARDLTEDKEIVVVPTKTIPQGITALISFQPEMNGEENLEAMMEAVSMVKTGQVTYAVRDTRLDEKEIHEGDIMGIGDHGILAVGKGRENVAKEMVAAMVDEDSEVISIYYGAETTEEDAESLAAELEEAYPDCEVEVNMGGQPIYYYIISVE